MNYPPEDRDQLNRQIQALTQMMRIERQVYRRLRWRRWKRQGFVGIALWLAAFLMGVVIWFQWRL